MERIGAGTTAIPHRDRARGARGRRAARRRGPWTRHNDTRDFVTVPPHRAIRGGSDRESTDHTTVDTALRCGLDADTGREPGPVKVKSRGSTALSKFFPSLTPARRGLFFQTSQHTRSERNPGAPARRAPGLNKRSGPREHGHTHTCVPMRTSPERGAPPKLYTLLHGESTKKNAQGKRGA